MATHFCKISTVDLTITTEDKSTVEISQNFLAFSEYRNFNIIIFTPPTMSISRHKQTLNWQFAATNAYLITGPGWAVQVRIPAPTRSQENILQNIAYPTYLRVNVGVFQKLSWILPDTQKYFCSKSLLEFEFYCHFLQYF